MTWWRRKAVVGAATALLLGALTAAPVAQSQVACPQPYEPYLTVTAYPGTMERPDLGTSIALEAQPPDTDGDGKPDVITSSDPPNSRVTVERGDGAIVLEPGPAHSYIYEGSYSPQPGDLDGDGRDELVIGVDQQGEQYVLPGSTAPGTYDIADVAVFLDGFPNVFMLVGDQDGDGGADLAFPAKPSNPEEMPDRWEVVSGPALLSAGPGGSASAGAPIASYTAESLSAATIEGDGPPTILTARGKRGATDGDVFVTVHLPDRVELVAPRFPPAYSWPYTGHAGASRDGDVVYVTLGTGSRSGTTLAVWNLADPCARAATGIPAAPPSGAPVSGEAAYTG